MPLAPEERPGRSFATDLRLIREKRGLSTQDVYRATKLPLEIVTLFEQTGLLNHPRYNKVYLRSLVREYARVVGIREQDATEALESTISGRYRGNLAVTYLGLDQSQVPAAEHQREAPSAAGRHAEQAPAPAQEPSSRTETRPARVEAASIPDRPSESRWKPPKVKVTPVRRPVSGTRLAAVVGSLTVLAAAIAASVYVIFFSDPTTRPASAGEEQLVIIDTTSQSDSLRDAGASVVPALGDTMLVQVIAARGKLEPIRKSADGGQITPHWVEEGDTLSFKCAEEFVLFGFVSRFDLLVDGHQIPADSLGLQNQVTVNREEVLAYIQQTPVLGTP